MKTGSRRWTAIALLIGLTKAAHGEGPTRAEAALGRESARAQPFGIAHVNLAALRAGPWTDVEEASWRAETRRGWRGRVGIDVSHLHAATLFLFREGAVVRATGEIPMAATERWLEGLSFRPTVLGGRALLRHDEGAVVLIEPHQIVAASSQDLLARAGTSTLAPALQAWLEKGPADAYAWAEAAPPGDLPELKRARITPRRISASVFPRGKQARLGAVCELESPKMARRALWWLTRNAGRWRWLLPRAARAPLEEDARSLRLKSRGRSLVLDLRLSSASLRALAGVVVPSGSAASERP